MSTNNTRRRKWKKRLSPEFRAASKFYDGAQWPADSAVMPHMEPLMLHRILPLLVDRGDGQGFTDKPLQRDEWGKGGAAHEVGFARRVRGHACGERGGHGLHRRVERRPLGG